MSALGGLVLLGTALALPDDIEASFMTRPSRLSTGDSDSIYAIMKPWIFRGLL